MWSRSSRPNSDLSSASFNAAVAATAITEGKPSLPALELQGSTSSSSQGVSSGGIRVRGQDALQLNNSGVLAMNISHESHGQQSGRSGAGSQMNTPKNQGSSMNGMDSFNRYFHTVLPGKAQKVMDNVMVGYEKFKDIVEKQIKPNRFRLSDQEVHKLMISLSEFDEYRRKIDSEFREYQQQKQMTGSFEDHLHDMHLNQNLRTCYARVPEIFFLGAKEVEGRVQEEQESEEKQEQLVEDFPLMVQLLQRNMRELQKYQDQLVEHLDEVELNLFYQVYFRFNQILELILDFDKMGKQCEENLVKVKLVRRMNDNLKKTLCSKGVEIAKQKKRIDRIKQALEILLIIREFANDPNASEADQADPSINDQKGDLPTKIQGTNIYKIIERRYQNVDKLKETDCYAEFLEESGAYLKEGFSFHEPIKRGVSVEHSIDISSIQSYNSNLHNDSSIQYDNEDDEVDESLTVFEWVCNEIAISHLTEMRLVSLYLLASRGFELIRFEVFKNGILKEVRRFFSYLKTAFREYCQNIYSTHSDQPSFVIPPQSGDADGLAFLNQINDILLMKFAAFFSTLARSFLTRLLSLLAAMKDGAIKWAIDKEFITSSCRTSLFPIILAITQLQVEASETFAEEMLVYLRYTNTETEANLAFKITTSNDLFAYWIDRFPAVFAEHTTIKAASKDLLDISLRTELIAINDDAASTFNLNFFLEQKSHLQFELFSTFDLKQLSILEHSLSRDTWLPINISFKIYLTLDYFFVKRGASDSEIYSRGDQLLQLNSVLKQRGQMITGSDSEQEEEEDEEEDLQDMSSYYSSGKLNREYKIQLNKLLFEKEGRRYMMTEGFLVFLRQLQRYIGLLCETSSISYSQSQFEKIIEFIRFYNSFSRELIVNARATKLPQMQNRITVKNLAMSSSNLSFMLKVLQKIPTRLPESIKVSEEFKKLSEDVTNHIQEIFNTITGILKDMVGKAAMQVNVLVWHAPSEKINVPLAQTARILDSLRTMHGVLDDILNEHEMKQIFEVILLDFIDVYIQSFANVMHSTSKNRLSVQRIEDELAYFTTEVTELSIFIKLPSAVTFIDAAERVSDAISSIPQIETMKRRLLLGDDSAVVVNSNTHDEEEWKESSQKKDEELERIAKKFSDVSGCGGGGSTESQGTKSPSMSNTTHDTSLGSKDIHEND